jgi:calcineurin-like phosphoesterase family protein
MTTFFTSDLHLFHKKIIVYNNHTRPFSTIEEMHEWIIKSWNELISEEDTVYILGDVSFSRTTPTVDILKQLNGKKILIWGNHDIGHIKKEAFLGCFTEVHQYLHLKENGINFILFHFPIAEWDMCHHSSIHLHGHLHGSPSGLEQYKIMDVGIDATGKIAVSIDEVIELLKDKEIKDHGTLKTKTVC